MKELKTLGVFLGMVALAMMMFSCGETDDNTSDTADGDGETAEMEQDTGAQATVDLCPDHEDETVKYVVSGEVRYAGFTSGPIYLTVFHDEWRCEADNQVAQIFPADANTSNIDLNEPGYFTANSNSQVYGASGAANQIQVGAWVVDKQLQPGDMPSFMDATACAFSDPIEVTGNISGVLLELTEVSDWHDCGVIVPKFAQTED